MQGVANGKNYEIFARKFGKALDNQTALCYNMRVVNSGLVAQLVRALACHARGREFKSLPARHYVSIAQSVEHRTENPCVGGSIPLRDTNILKRTTLLRESSIC